MTVQMLGRCLNPQCVRNDTDHENYLADWPVDAEIEDVTRFGEDGVFLRVPITVTQHKIPVDTSCPDCGMPAAMLDGKPPVYPKMVA
jgi:hypothetical protein